MALGTNNMTVTTGAVFKPAIWSMEVLRAAENALVIAPLVKRFDSLVTERGDTINIPNLSNLTANAKVAGAQVTLQSPTEANTQILINQHYEASFLVEDLLKVQSNYDLLAEYTSKAGYAIAQQIDTALLSQYTNFTSTDVGSYGVDLTAPTILAAAESIDLANAPVEDRYMIIYPTQKTALMQIDKFIRKDYVGDYQSPGMTVTGPNSRYEFGDVFGIKVYYTKQVVQTAGTPTQTSNIMFQKEAIALALQQAPRTQSDYRLEYIGTLVVVDAVYGTKTIRGDFAVEMRS